MMNGLALALHVSAAVVWLGGMFFAHQALRPAAMKLDPPLRLPLWCDTFARFFPWVWLAVTLLPITGLWLLFRVFGGFATAPWYVHVMLLLGTAMIAIFLHVFFAPYRRLRTLTAEKQFPQAAEQLAKIRRLVGINIILGLLTVAAATIGRMA